MTRSLRGYALPLLKQFIFIFLLLLSVPGYCQDHLMYKTIDPENRAKFFKLTKPGNKVYVASGNKPLAIHGARILSETYYWKVVDDIKDADFVLYIDDTRLFASELSAFAVYVDPDSREPFYKTHKANTLDVASFHGKKAVVKELIKKRIVNRIDELDERDTMVAYRCRRLIGGKYHVKRDCEKIKNCEPYELSLKSAMLEFFRCEHCVHNENSSKYQNL